MAYPQSGRGALPVNAGVSIFGADAAEEDSNLNLYFLETDTWQRVVNGQLLLVLGRKGSGKSAIFKMLSEKPPQNSKVIPITPRLFALDILNEFTKKYPESPFNREIAYIASWRYSLMLELLLTMEQTTGNLKLGGEAGVHDWLRKNIEFDSDIISRTVAFLEKWTINKVSISQLTTQIGEDSKRGPLIGQDIDTTLPEIQKVLEKNRFIIAIDNLDEGWLNKEEARAYLVGLIMAGKELSRLKNLNVVIFMRTDMYRVLETAYQHMDKFRQAIDTITWNATSLGRLISMRIQRYYGVSDESNDATWGRLFPREMTNKFPTYKHITERTFLRPREIIQFCRLAVDVASKRKHNKVDEGDISIAENEYSEWKFKDLSGEYSAYYQNVNKFLECFRRSNPNITRKELEEIITTSSPNCSLCSIDDKNKTIGTEQTIELLYNMGFIRAKKRNYNGKWKYIASSSEPGLITSTIDYFDIHPAFRSKFITRK